MILYVAGPMSGLPEFNYPAFHAAARALRTIGHTVLNPAETVGAPDASWSWWMRQALGQVINAEAVALLPGWSSSRGALLEHHVATQLGMPIRSIDSWLRRTA